MKRIIGTMVLTVLVASCRPERVDLRSASKSEITKANGAALIGRIELSSSTNSTIQFSETSFLTYRFAVVCSGVAEAYSGNEFTITEGSKDCKVRLDGFDLGSGMSFHRVEEFSSLESGGLSTFRAGVSNNYLRVQIIEQLPTVITNSSLGVKFSAIPIEDGSTAEFESMVDGSIVGSISTASNLLLKGVRQIANDILELTVVCGAGDFSGADLRDLNCQTDSLSSHDAALLPVTENMSFSDLKARVSSAGVSFKSMTPRIEFASSASHYQTRVVVLSFRQSGISPGEYLLVLTNESRLWLRTYRVTIGSYVDHGTPPQPSPSMSPSASPSASPWPQPSNSASPTPTSTPTVESGRAIYLARCQGCHGPIASSAKAGRSAEQIKQAGAIAEMNFVRNMSDLDIESVALSLKVQVATAIAPMVANRFLVSSRFERIFLEPVNGIDAETAAIRAILRDELMSPFDFAGNCIAEERNPKCVGGGDISADLPFASKINPVRRGRVIGTCQRILQRPAIRGHLINFLGLNANDLPSSNAIGKLFSWFYPTFPASSGLVGELASQAQAMERDGTARATIWRATLTVVCQSSLMEQL